ncbi:InlB B-repeat-containing protein [Porphyromonas sp.]|uniref:InlB B-repeat-containing protein n=1 Tax=Porphyromonas sp. TaxID=1924944 RepID=UPI0039957FE4
MSKQLRIWLFVLLSTLLTSTTLPAEGVITMTTSKALGEKIGLAIKANGSVTIIGVQESAQTDGYSKYYTLTSQTITIRGNVTYLYCQDNQLTSLNDSGCTSLTELDCSYNQLTSLDVSGCTALIWLYCSNNQLTSLDVSKNTALTLFYCYNNRINGEAMTKLVNSLPNRTGKYSGTFRVMDSGSSEKNQCSPSDVSIVRDKNWEPEWSNRDPYIGPGEGISTMMTSKAVGEKINLAIKANGNVTIEGVGETPQLDGRSHSYTLTSQTVTIRGHAASLDCSGNQLTGLDLTRSTALISLNCSNNQLTSLDLSKNTALTTLNCSNNQLSNLDLSENRALKTLNCVSNQLTSLDLSNHSALESLSCEKNQLIRLNLSGCSGLKKLFCHTNQLIRLDISGCRALTKLECYGNQLTSLNASGCKSLTELDCQSNPLRHLDVSGCTALTKLQCQSNQLTNLDVSSCTALKKLHCQKNQLTNLNAQGCTALTEIQCQSNQLTSLNVSGMSNLTTLSCWKNQLSSLDVTSCTALTKLECYDNRLASLDVSKNNRLTTLDCQQNQLASLNLSGCRALTTLKCNKNQLTSLNLSDCVALKEFYCPSNKLTSLDFYTCRALTKLDCSDNALSGIDLLQCRELSWLRCSINQIKTSAMTALITSLPDRQGRTAGMLQVVDKESTKEGNLCFADHVTKAKAKNWQAQSYQSNNWSDYAGSEVPTFAVTSSATTGGMVAIIGAPDLTKVPYGTELTVITEFADGYKLTALTANGKDILATKKFLVTEATEVKATFMPLTCSVSLIFNQEEGTITVPGVSNLDEVAPDTELTIEVTPAAGYELTSLTANGRDILATKKVVVTENMTIKATFAKKHLKVSTEKVGEGLFEVTGADDLNSVLYGTELTVSVTPATGYELTSLMANETDISATKKVIVKENLTIKATFTKKAFAVTLSKEGEGTLATTGAEDLKAVPYGTEVTIVATPATGYELKSIEANGTDITATKKVVVREAVAVKATFVKKTFAVELTKEGEGTLAASGAEDLSAVPYGTKLTITATPAEGYELQSLVADGVDIIATKKIVVKDNLTVKATFAKKSFAVSLTKEGEGTITATGASNLNSVAYGTELTIVATPAEGYELTALTANGTDILASKKVIVKEALEVKATFTKKSFAVSLTKEGEGTITATGASNLNSVAYGTELTIVATPAEGYELTALTANGTDILASKKVIVKEAVEVKATFAKKSFAVSLTKEGEGTITATGATSLNAVAYGTELTIVATPAEGYELTALTANGTDILASKKVIVKEALEVKATFTKKSFAVSLTKEGEGTITATGASNLNSVAYGTELTIVATPAEGYELTALTANGTDILATKKIVVTDSLTVTATFTKKSFAVSLTKEGEGTITATGASNLNSVAYGTELTIVATPAEGYELTTLTANGTDILATKKVVVTDNMTVKATFAKKSFAVSLTKEGEGTISATGASSLNAVAYGTELTINATPAMGYELTALTANGTDILATKKIVVEGNLTVKATFAKKNFAVSLTKEGEGTITATGASNLNAVAYGTELTINATPAEGYELVSITADGTDITASRKVVVTGNLTVKATFAKKSFAVSLTKEGEGTISATGASDLNSVAYGTELTIVATPAEGYELTALTANGTDILATKKIVVEGNLTVKATFTKKSFAVSLTKEGEGTISATGASDLNSVAYGTELTIVATPAEGYELTALTANGTDILATKKIVVEGNLTVKATFTKKSFAVSLTKEGEGTITATGASSLNAVAYGTELTIVATPAEGYELTALTANGTDILATKKIVVTDNVTIKATFAKKSFAVTFAKEGEGTISATGANDLNAVAYDTELTIVATPATGYELVSITANGADITATKKIVVTDNMTIKATFAKKSFAVSLTKEGEGTITATGASNLNSVAYGTELTINATPAEGYELQSLVAGGVDITATKKIVVKGNLTVKATFAKKSFAVSLTKEGEGMITATGASNLNSVAYGTELTIVATPAEGYELTALTANGTDILATKKVVVEGNLTVKATFAKKAFAVSLTKEGDGTITATGASNLNSVAYGTELTINATPAEGYELTALTSNGTDILATKKVVVEGNLTVKATFAKKAFAVSLTKEGDGTITATGASNLNSVAYGTELTINATPAEGYELTALTSNGTDILATKKVVVEGNLTVKATFEKKTFAVTLTSNEHGEITIVEPVNLEAVPYGTPLTVKATGKNAQCVLTELTANGEDILASQSFVVTDVTEVKATFVDHTGVETTVTQQVKLYPNPATDYVIVEGVAPASEVTLHSMTGERLYAGRVDDRGTLQIDLTPYADGVYLVCVAGETYRVVVRH